MSTKNEIVKRFFIKKGIESWAWKECQGMQWVTSSDVMNFSDVFSTSHRVRALPGSKDTSQISPPNFTGLLTFFGQDFFDLRKETGKFLFGYGPYNFIVNAKVVMDHFIPHTHHIFPWNLGVRLPDVYG